MHQLAVKGTYRAGVVAPENAITFDEDTEVVLVFPLREDTAIVFESVEDESVRLVFKKPLKAKLSADEDILFLSYPELGITAYGQDLREAIQSFNDVFVATFTHYAQHSDSQLTATARSLKTALLELIQERMILAEVES